MKMLKREKRNIIETIGLIVFGILIMICGLALFIVSIPLMLILIGFGSAFIAVLIMLFGFIVFNNAFYKPIVCVKCYKQLNPSIFKNDITCTSCKTFYTFRNGK
jgi:hypothetical protein